MNDAERLAVVKACKWADEVVFDTPYAPTIALLVPTFTERTRLTQVTIKQTEFLTAKTGQIKLSIWYSW
jgi:hypothetical protein